MNLTSGPRQFRAFLRPYIHKRLKELESLERESTLRDDCIDWIIELSAKVNQRHETYVLNSIVGLMLASFFQMPMLITFALHSLCKHPEYIKPLREEVEKMTEKDVYAHDKESFPRLDSFLKETARLNPLLT
ncbi:MAG: hypothetical protein M1821_007158, partial [Bathelium mastoideum]